MSFPLVKRSNDTSAGPSASIWAAFNTADFIRNPELGYDVFEDFNGGFGPFLGFEDGTGGSDVKQLANFLGGAIRLNCTTDNETSSVYLGAVPDEAGVVDAGVAGGGGFLISTTAGSEAMLAFEARIRPDVVSDTISTIFAGLTDQAGLATTAFPITADDVFADVACLGFIRPANNGDELDVAYNEASEIQNDHGEDVLAATENTTALVANTWVKLGFVFNPNSNRRSDGTNQDRITFYVNGEALGDPIDAADLAVSDFPDGAGMVPCVSFTAASGTTTTVDVDWIRCAQFRV